MQQTRAQNLDKDPDLSPFHHKFPIKRSNVLTKTWGYIITPISGGMSCCDSKSTPSRLLRGVKMGRDYLKSNKNKWESILPFDLFYVFIMIVASSCYCSLSKAQYTKKLIDIV